jgi:hypothetical protein
MGVDPETAMLWPLSVRPSSRPTASRSASIRYAEVEKMPEIEEFGASRTTAPNGRADHRWRRYTADSYETQTWQPLNIFSWRFR